MILDRIVAQKQKEIALAKETNPLEQLVTKIGEPSSPRPFLALNPLNFPLKLIAEIKKASPSKGLIRDFTDPAPFAGIYEKNGASSISVLTDIEFFRGDPTYLNKARQATTLPLLRKDFIIDPYQVYESKYLGADTILLIAAILKPRLLGELLQLAAGLQLQVLVEVHTAEELEVVLDTPASFIGINNRNLKTFVTDINTTLRLRDKIHDPGRIVVSESGIKTADDIALLARNGVDAVLIGESLMAAEDPGAKIRELFKAAGPDGGQHDEG